MVIAAVVTALIVGAGAGATTGWFAGRSSRSAMATTTTAVSTLPTTTTTTSSTTTTSTTTTVPPTTVKAQPDIPALVRKITLSVVDIDATGTYTDSAGRRRSGSWSGSGFVIDSTGIIATNAHVVDGADTLTVSIHDGTAATATLLGMDVVNDLAVIRIDRTDLPALPLATSHSVVVGELVVAAGNALGMTGNPSITVGVVSGVDRSITLDNDVSMSNLLQTDAAISSGDSGGPLMLGTGEVIGIDTAGASSDGVNTAENIGFAIPITRAAPILRALAGLSA